MHVYIWQAHKARVRFESMKHSSVPMRPFTEHGIIMAVPINVISLSVGPPWRRQDGGCPSQHRRKDGCHSQGVVGARMATATSSVSGMLGV